MASSNPRPGIYPDPEPGSVNPEKTVQRPFGIAQRPFGEGLSGLTEMIRFDSVLSAIKEIMENVSAAPVWAKRCLARTDAADNLQNLLGCT